MVDLPVTLGSAPPIDPRPPLLLLPGTLCDGEVFQPLIEALEPSSASWHVIVETLEGGDTVEAVATRILADAPPRFALLGFSLGGIVALSIAAMAPERLLGLALVDSNARDVPAQDRPGRHAEAEQGAADLERHIRQTLWPRYVAASARDDEDLRDAIVDMALRCGPAALMTQTAIGLSRPDSRPRLNDIKIPALVLAGAEDVLCPPQVQHDIALGLPLATLALIADAGHFALLEQPATVARHVMAWLERLGAPSAVAL